MKTSALLGLGLACVVAVVLATLALAPMLPGGGARVGSSWSQGPDGTASLYALLQDASRNVRRHEGSVRSLATDGTVLVVAPATDFSAADAGHLIGLAEAGARLVVATERPLDLLTARGAVVEDVGRHTDAKPDVPSAAARAGWPLLDGSTAAAQRVPGLAPLYADDAGVRVGSLAVGDGQLIVVTLPGLFSNAGLSDRVNRRLALALLDAPGELVFLESVHGFRGDHGPWPWLRRRGFGPWVLFALSAPTCFAWRAGARLRAVHRRHVLTPAGLVGLARAAGALRASQGDHGEALEVLVSDRLRRGLPPGHAARRWYEEGARTPSAVEALGLARSLEESS